MNSKYKIIITGLLIISAVVISGCINEDSNTIDKMQIQSEIQAVLDEQCSAIKNKDINSLMETFDINLSKNYDEMKTGWQSAFLDVNVTGCNMVITGVEVSDDIITVEVEGTMTNLLLFTGETETKNFTETNKFKKVGGSWKQVY